MEQTTKGEAPAGENPAIEAPVRRKPPAIVMLLGMTAGLGIILVVLLMVFIMPSLKSGPHDLPTGVAASSAVFADFQKTLDAAAPGAYAPQRFDSEDDLTAAILARDVVGGFVVDDSGTRVLVASAGSAAISATITATAQGLGEQSGVPIPVTDLVPLPDADPTGIGIGGLAFPLVFGGIVPAVAFRKLFPRSLGWTVAGILTFAGVGGIAVASVLTFVFGSIITAFWPVAASMALGIAALAIPLAGLQECFGGKGFTIGAMVMMFLGNPLAGISTTAAWLPAGLGAVGQLLPPGATGSLVRSAAYFGGAGGIAAALTLALWVCAGIVLLVIGRRRATAANASR